MKKYPRRRIRRIPGWRRRIPRAAMAGKCRGRYMYSFVSAHPHPVHTSPLPRPLPLPSTSPPSPPPSLSFLPFPPYTCARSLSPSLFNLFLLPPTSLSLSLHRLSDRYLSFPSFSISRLLLQQQSSIFPGSTARSASPTRTCASPITRRTGETRRPSSPRWRSCSTSGACVTPWRRR